MHVQRVMNHTGDTAYRFDPANSAEVKEAMERFNELVKNQRFVAARKVGDGCAELVREFDPAHEEVVFHRPLKGG